MGFRIRGCDQRHVVGVCDRRHYTLTSFEKTRVTESHEVWCIAYFEVLWVKAVYADDDGWINHNIISLADWIFTNIDDTTYGS